MYDRFHEWNEDWLRAEMEAVPPSIIKPKRVTRVDLILGVLDYDKPLTGIQIAALIGDTPNSVFSTMPAIHKSGRAVRVCAEGGQVAWVLAK